MKVLILAGGLGTRLSEETEIKPKPMVEIGGKPILWHIMKYYSSYNFNEFIILLGYKGYVIKEYFSNLFLHHCDVTINMHTNKMDIHNNTAESWKVTLIDTGIDTMTGGRIKRAQQYVGKERFMLTYGDGVSNVDLDKLLAFHAAHKKSLTVTSVQPENRFGMMDIGTDGKVSRFIEKPKEDNAWVNSGFFVCEPEVFDFIKDDATIFEREPLEQLAKKNQLYAYKHSGFWHCMDTQRDKIMLNELWNNGNAQWKRW